MGIVITGRVIPGLKKGFYGRGPVLNGSIDRSKIRLFWFSALQSDMLLKKFEVPE